MKKVFIDPLTIVTNFDGTSGYRLVDVVNEGNTFPIAEPYFWAECADEVEGNQILYYYDNVDSTIKLRPVEPEENIDALLEELLAQQTT